MSSFLSRWAQSIETSTEGHVLPATAVDNAGVLGPDQTSIPNDVGQSWSEWKARSLNEEFRRLTGIRGRITAETVRHGERSSRIITAAKVHFASLEPAHGYTLCGRISEPGYATFNSARVDCPECRRQLMCDQGKKR
jgi:hypothetical protein